jgi:predicted nucleic acid-binding protein
MAVIVSDTSPLRALDHLGRLDLLTAVFDRVVVPPAVRDELLHPRRRFKPIEIAAIPHAVVQAPANSRRVSELCRELQTGEAQAIALAEELDVQLLIDEMAGRTVAQRLGLRTTGVVGLLVEAKSRGLVDRVIPSLERLRSELGFFLSAKLVEDVRVLCGE